MGHGRKISENFSGEDLHKYCQHPLYVLRYYTETLFSSKWVFRCFWRSGTRVDSVVEGRGRKIWIYDPDQLWTCTFCLVASCKDEDIQNDLQTQETYL